MIDLSYLTISVRETIVTDVVEIAKYHSIHRRMNEGSFGIPRQVFCYVDFLGSIAYGNQGEEEAIAVASRVDRASGRKIAHFKPAEAPGGNQRRGLPL